MAITRIPTQTLSVGDAVISIPFTPEGDSVSLTVSSEQVGSAASQIRFTVRDSTGLVIASQVINGTGSKRVLVIDGSLRIEISCLLGSARVLAVESTGGGLVSGDISTDSITSDKFSGDGAVGSDQLASNSITNDHVADAIFLGDKLEDDSLLSAALATSAFALGRADFHTSYFVDGNTITPPVIDGGMFRAIVTTDDLGNPADVTMGAGSHRGQVVIIEHRGDEGGNVRVITTGGWLDTGAASAKATLQNDSGGEGTLIAVCVGGTEWRALAYYFTVFSAA